MQSVSQKSATAGKRRFLFPIFGVNLNFCRNAQCAQFGVHLDPRDGRGKNLSLPSANFLRGEVKGKGDKKNLTCDACGQKSVLKNNRAIVEEYTRLRRLQRPDGAGKSVSGA